MLLDIRDLDVRFEQRGRTVYAVNRLALQVAKGEIVAVVGESGAGKSQAFLAITRLADESARITGHAWLDGADLLAMPEESLQRVRGRQIAYVFQDPMTALNPYLKIGTQLLEVLARHRGLKGRAARDEAVRMLERVRIPEPAARMRQYPHQLSGGQCQRVMLAMALLGHPRLLVADEPTTALDVTVQRQVLDLLRELQAELGFSLVIITHDLGVVARIAHRVIVMYGGRVMESAPVLDLFRHPRHPYTRGLLAAAPRLDGGPMRPIPGVPPKMDRLFEGCPFAPRCDNRMNECQKPLPLIEVAKNHFVACHSDSIHE